MKTAKTREERVRAIAQEIKGSRWHQHSTEEECREVAEELVDRLDKLAFWNRKKRKKVSR